MYVKISQSNQILVWPYTIVNLRDENNNTSYDDRFSLSEWYLLTDDAKTTGCKVEFVKEVFDLPINQISQKYQKNELPEYINNEWVIRSIVVDKSADELNQTPTE